ncbi:Aminopeptidase M1 [Vitis vinifera]|uniref:Aminopeptidase M1 n=1 Tax=Vitis vinifera TaxID=29760 RepID=A0A438K6Y7_VITVI|nr:Aminopeptidase M1 [Vitis vinifera]
MSTYMKRYAGKNAKTDDLWSVLSEESGIQVNSMMDTWTKQKGYPLISVKSKDNILELEQSQFLSSGSFGQVRTVDISELLYSSDSNLSSSKGNDQGKCKEHSWVKVNVEQTGFYRVKYDDKLAAQLRNAIEENCLSETDKFGVLDDTFALCEACQLSLSSLLSLMDAYRKEFDYILISRLIDVKTFILFLAAYIAVMRNTSSTNRTGYESLLKVYRESDGVQEKEPILLTEFISIAIQIRDQDSLYVLSGISLEAHETAWSWLKENWDLIPTSLALGCNSHVGLWGFYIVHAQLFLTPAFCLLPAFDPRRG